MQDGQVRLACPPLEPSARAAAPLAKIPEDDSVQQLSLVVNVAIALPYEVCHSGAVTVTASSVDTVASIKEKVCALEQIPFVEHTLSLGDKLLDDGETLARCGVGAASALDFWVRASEDALAHQMAAILRSRGPLSKADLDDLFSCRHGLGASGALKTLGWGEKLLPFLQRHPLFSVTSGCVALAPDAMPPPPPEPAANRRFLDLHAELRADCPLPKLSDSLDRLAETLASTAFLNIRRVVTGGGLANGTAIRGAVGAKVVLFVEGLPPTGHDRLLPGLASSMSGALADRVEELGAATVEPDGLGGLRVRTSGDLGEVQVLFSPDYACSSDALEALRAQGDAAQHAAAASLVDQKVRFVARQPEGVKAAVRVVKSWREGRRWSCDAARPNDDLLELVVAHTLAQRAPRDLADAVSSVLSVLGRFDELRATWPLASRSYREGDIPKELLKQRPLLLDPVSPLVNVAGPRHFRPEEMIAHARSGACFD
uniref:Ubiquitin-like domain-containing protein n=1 Tax=Zooxanthella nutricula TaxID=1333877 RepID=A0A7S2KCH9_9DINO